jgi:hypothetical protein
VIDQVFQSLKFHIGITEVGWCIIGDCWRRESIFEEYGIQALILKSLLV